jgi:hypothetical protein
MKSVSLIIVLLATTSMCFGQAKSFSELTGDVSVQPVKILKGEPIPCPFQSWSADIGFLQANGGYVTTKDSIYGKMGCNFKFYKQDYFPTQVQDFMSGKTPFLRGAYVMYGMAAEKLNSDPRTKPVILCLMSYSIGDHAVSREGIKNLNDLKKLSTTKKLKLACQQGGAHVIMMDKILATAQIPKESVEVVWVKDLTGADSGAAVFKKDKSIDVCFAVTPDVIGLCGMDEEGNFTVGSGAETTVKGAHVLVSTREMSRAIPDVIACRADWYKDNKETAEKFVAGYLKAVEGIVVMRKSFDGKKLSSDYRQCLQMMQNAFGKDVVPTLEIDGHGYLLDAVFAGLPGQIAFFEDRGNQNGFEAEMSNVITVGIDWGYAKNRRGFDSPGFDYKKIAELADLKYTKPETTNRIIAESLDTFDNLDDRTIIEFPINFLPNQEDFSADRYGAEFERVIKLSGTFANAIIVVKGHSDPTLALMTILEAGKKTGHIEDKGKNGKHDYYFNGKPLDVTQTATMVKLILDGKMDVKVTVFGKDENGQKIVLVDNSTPKEVLQSAVNLSLARAGAVKEEIIKMAKAKGINLDESQIQKMGAGVSEPKNSKPKNKAEALENMRVEFSLVKVPAEAIKVADYDY